MIDPDQAARLAELERRREDLHRRFARLHENLIEQRDHLDSQVAALNHLGDEITEIDRALEEAHERSGR